MKILVMTTLPQQFTCGVNTHISYLLQGLQNLGLDHDLLTYPSSVEYTRRAFAKRLVRKLKIDLFDTWLRRQKIEYFKRLIKERFAVKQYDVIHSHDCYATHAVLEVIHPPIPIITTMHGPVTFEMISTGERKNSRLVQETFAIEKQAFQMSTLCIAVDTTLKTMLEQEYAVRPEKIVTIPNAVHIEHIISLARGRHPFDIPQPFFLVPRRLVPKNGIEFAIRALSFSRPNISLAIAGEGPLRQSLSRLVAEGDLGDRVFFLGDVPQARLLPLMMSASGVIVPSVPSHGVIEATSLAVLEAMACKRPIIASQIGGISDILTPVGYPFLTPAGDDQLIGRFMEAILDAGQSEMEAILQKNFDHLLQTHSSVVWMQALLDSYRSACGIPASCEAC